LTLTAVKTALSLPSLKHKPPKNRLPRHKRFFSCLFNIIVPSSVPYCGTVDASNTRFVLRDVPHCGTADAPNTRFVLWGVPRYGTVKWNKKSNVCSCGKM